jgi:D-amino-acid dehydrogenase
MKTHHNTSSVLVLGAGVAGLAAAWALHHQGFRVSVMDEHEEVAQGASFANGAQLSYCHVQPLADPGIWRQLPSLLFSKSSAFALRLEPSWAQWQWLVAFAWASRREVSNDTTRHLLALGLESRQALENMLVRTEIDCLHRQAGKLMLYSSKSSFAAARQQMAFQAKLGCQQQAISASEAVAVEPALRGYQQEMEGAVYTPSEDVADCHRLCTQLRHWLTGQGVTFLMGQPAQRLMGDTQHVVGVQTAKGLVQADHYVMAAGARSRALTAPVLPMASGAVRVYPLKGYSVTLDLAGCEAAAPTVSVTDTQRKLVFARLGDQLRVAGVAELRGHDMRIEERRVKQVLSAVHEVFGGVKVQGDVRPWCGHRPATPSSRPLVGQLKQGPDNLWMHTGHGMLGWTLAFGTAQRLASSLQGYVGGKLRA